MEAQMPTPTDPGLYHRSREVSAEEAQAHVEELLMEKDAVSSAVQSLSCTWGACMVHGPVKGEAGRRSGFFQEEAQRLRPVVDKVTTHTYQIMYGTFLLPAMDRPGAKLLEIGLGCDMPYGSGASVALWKRLFRPDAEIWGADFNATCVEAVRSKGLLDGIHTVVGDQGNRTTVEAWVRETGGQFDAIVDDGGHENDQILTSFLGLWPALKPGGLYCLEDLQVGRDPEHQLSESRIVIADLVKVWVQQLAHQLPQKDWPLPQNLGEIWCQREACLLRKSVEPHTP